MHVACMLAAASTLSAARDEWKGTLVILFQPNEERGAGAKAMVEDGLYRAEGEGGHGCPVPDVVLGQHVMPFVSCVVSLVQAIIASREIGFSVLSVSLLDERKFGAETGSQGNLNF